MKRIDTTQISDPNALQPFTGKSLKFLQDRLSEVINIIHAGYVGRNFYSAPKTIYGFKKMDNGGGNYTFSEGYVFYNGELYEHELQGSVDITDTAVCVITTSNDATADPVVFRDGITRNVHNIKKIVVQDGSTGSGDFDYNWILPLNLKVQQKVIKIGDWDMDSDSEIIVEHGMAEFMTNLDPFIKIVGLDATIYSDVPIQDSIVFDFKTGGYTNDNVNHIEFQPEAIRLFRNTSGFFNNTKFKDPGNRGYITISYIYNDSYL